MRNATSQGTERHHGKHMPNPYKKGQRKNTGLFSGIVVGAKGFEPSTLVPNVWLEPRQSVST